MRTHNMIVKKTICPYKAIKDYCNIVENTKYII